MPFEKGKSGNPKGRPKGSLNQTTKDIRVLIKEVLCVNFNKTKITKDLRELTAKGRLDFYLKLLEFAVPKYSSTEFESDVDDEDTEFWVDMYESLRKKK